MSSPVQAAAVPRAAGFAHFCRPASQSSGPPASTQQLSRPAGINRLKPWNPSSAPPASPTLTSQDLQHPTSHIMSPPPLIAVAEPRSPADGGAPKESVQGAPRAQLQTVSNTPRFQSSITGPGAASGASDHPSSNNTASSQPFSSKDTVLLPPPQLDLSHRAGSSAQSGQRDADSMADSQNMSVPFKQLALPTTPLIPVSEGGGLSKQFWEAEADVRIENLLNEHNAARAQAQQAEALVALTPSDISSSKPRLVLAFVAQLMETQKLMETQAYVAQDAESASDGKSPPRRAPAPKTVVKGVRFGLVFRNAESLVQHAASSDFLPLEQRNASETEAAADREERYFRNWASSLGVDLDNYEGSFRSGIAMLKVQDKLQPGVVEWNKVHKNPVNTFEKLENCNYMLQVAEKMNVKVVGIDGADIVSGSPKHTLAIWWQLMRKDCMDFIEELDMDTADVLCWANDKVADSGCEIQLARFGDSQLQSGVYLLELLRMVAPNDVKPSLVRKGVTSRERELNARYAISCAHKLGCRIFCSWGDLVQPKPNPKIVLALLASIMALDVRLHQEEEQDVTGHMSPRRSDISHRCCSLGGRSVASSAAGRPEDFAVVSAAGLQALDRARSLRSRGKLPSVHRGASSVSRISEKEIRENLAVELNEPSLLTKRKKKQTGKRLAA
eukprot:6206717-Pleurochrysis_carterae.AAC.1